MTSTTLLEQSTTAETNTLTLPALSEADIRKESCDRCGTQSSPARFVAEKETHRLFFCAHHTREFAASLTQKGFTITPPDFSFESLNK